MGTHLGAQAMTYTEEDLVRETAQIKSRLKEFDARTCAEVWDAFCKWIVECLQKGKGVNVPFLVKLMWKQESGIDSFPKAYKPIFIFGDSFLKSHSLMLHKNTPRHNEDGTCTRSEEINFAKIAFRYTQCLSKDTVFAITRRMFQRLGTAFSEGQKAKVDVGVGFIICHERKLSFVWKAAFCHRIVHKSGKVIQGSEEADPLLDTSAEGILLGHEVEMHGEVEDRAPVVKPTAVAADDSLDAHVHETFQVPQTPPLCEQQKTPPMAKMVQEAEEELEEQEDSVLVVNSEIGSPNKEYGRERAKRLQKLSDMAVESAYRRQEMFADLCEKYDEHNMEVGRERLEEAEKEMTRRNTIRQEKNLQQKEYLKVLIKQKEKEKLAEKKDRLVNGFNYGNTQKAFPEEPDRNEGLALAKKQQEQASLRKSLQAQMGAKKRLKRIDEQELREIEKQDLERAESQMRSEFSVNQAMKQNGCVELQRAWERQVALKNHAHKRQPRARTSMNHYEVDALQNDANKILSRLGTS